MLYKTEYYTPIIVCFCFTNAKQICRFHLAFSFSHCRLTALFSHCNSHPQRCHSYILALLRSPPQRAISSGKKEGRIPPEGGDECLMSLHPVESDSARTPGRSCARGALIALSQFCTAGTEPLIA